MASSKKRVRYAAIKKRMTPEEGKRMRCTRGAYATHRAIRLEGRTPGDEGRKAIALNREARKRYAEMGKARRVGHVNLDGV